MTSFGKFRGCFRIVSSRAFKRRIVRLSAAIRSRVMTWGRLTPPPPPSKSRVAKYPSKCRVKTYRVLFPLVDALRSFRVSRGGGTYVPPPPAVRRWLRPPAVRGLIRALLGLWIFHRLLGGGGRLNAPPMISAPGCRREKRKVAFESSRKIISKSFRSFFGSGQNWSLQGSKFQNFPKRFFDNKIFNFKDRATNLIPSCLSR